MTPEEDLRKIMHMNAYLGLGSNLGDRMENLCEAVCRLNKTECIEVREISPVYETYPVGGPEQPKYLNAVMRVETALGAEYLLRACLSIESSMGRVRKERWGPRVVDIDVLLFGSLVMYTPELTLPHPRLHERGFVLRPLADIAPDLVHPVLGETVRKLLNSSDISGVVRLKETDLVCNLQNKSNITRNYRER